MIAIPPRPLTVNAPVKPPASFREVIARWPATRFFARDAGCSPLLARQWRHRNFIPPQYWPRITAGAARRGFAEVDADLLARLAAALRGAGAPAGKTPAGKTPAGKTPAGGMRERGTDAIGPAIGEEEAG
jgi:hypothetical protein